MIKSLLDQDFYKFTMGQIAFHRFPNVNVKYEFKCRNEAKWTMAHVSKITREIDRLCSLRFSADEIKYLSTLQVFKNTYLEFLKLLQLNSENISVELHNDELCISAYGPWYLSIYWEIFILSIVNETYFQDRLNYSVHKSGVDRLNIKSERLRKRNIPFADFGTRRRFSADWQDKVICHLRHVPGFKGTSNVYLAKKYNLKPIGTMAHEFLQVGQAIDVSLIDFQKHMLQVWADEYRGNLGIALTDIVGFDAFLRDFDLYFAKLYDGLRHDSGDPFKWADKAIAYYRHLGINPKTKTLVFSDGLDLDKAYSLFDMFSETTNVIFGIGTNFTNDFEGITPLQIVMKIVEVDGKPVAKISDSSGKGMCKDPLYEEHLRKLFNIK